MNTYKITNTRYVGDNQVEASVIIEADFFVLAKSKKDIFEHGPVTFYRLSTEGKGEELVGAVRSYDSIVLVDKDDVQISGQLVTPLPDVKSGQ